MLILIAFLMYVAEAIATEQCSIIATKAGEEYVAQSKDELPLYPPSNMVRRSQRLINQKSDDTLHSNVLQGISPDANKLKRKGSKGSLRIALASDFFCPNAGGVETHIYYLAQCLIRFGHKVIVITHAYGDRKGIRYLSNGLKVYYLPFLVAYNGCSIPTVLGSTPWFREIFLRERIQIVHGHSTFSTVAHESMFHAWSLGLKTCFTDHSLFGFADASAILTNKLVLQYSLANVDRVICVSHTSKENTVLRSHLPPEKVSVIPNAIDCDLFVPDKQRFMTNPTTIIVLSRLVYRKGSDLLAEIIPPLCAKYANLRFIIGGDGPKRILIEEAREQYHLHDRVAMLGMLPHSQVRDVMVEGHIFLNTSLTEAFCMSIVEAASCGLHVVTTRVGGIPEVLPEDLMIMTEPDPALLVRALDEAIKMREESRMICPNERHERVRRMYVWPDVARRTEVVYRSLVAESDVTWAERIRRFYRCGLGFSVLFIVVGIINMMVLTFLEWWRPAESVPEANDRPLAILTNPNQLDEESEEQTLSNHLNISRFPR